MRISDWSSDVCSSDLPILVSPTPSPRRIAIEQPPMRIGRVGGNHGNTMPVPRHRIGEAAREGTDPGGLGALKIAEQQEAHQRWLYPIRLLETRFTTRAAAEAPADLIVIVKAARKSVV